MIDAEFHTNDASIRAAGPLTKFSRRYYRDELTHSNFNSKEIGFELAASMLSLFESAPQPSSGPPEGSDRLIPIYSRCKVQGMSSWIPVTLPSLLRYFCSSIVQAGLSHLRCHLLALQHSRLLMYWKKIMAEGGQTNTLFSSLLMT